MVDSLKTIEIEPTEDIQGSVIWLHGLGASGHDFVPIVPMLKCPQLRFIFPNAPAQPVTLNYGTVMPSWYDIRHLEESDDRENLDDVRASAALIEQLIEREEERGVSADKIILAGFSQGGAITYHLGCRIDKTLRGLMVLSSYMVRPDTLDDEWNKSNADTPLLVCHGQYDDMVPHGRGRKAYDLLKAKTPERSSEFHDFPMGHEVCLEEIEVIARWFHERLNAKSTNA